MTDSNGRYMPQDMFNILVVVAAMAILMRTSQPFREVIQTYRKDYTSETVELEQEASAGGVRLLQLIEDYPPQGGKNHSHMIERQDELLTILYRLLVDASKQDPRPFWKRMFGGTRFNYSPIPLSDRRETAINVCIEYLPQAIVKAG